MRTRKPLITALLAAVLCVMAPLAVPVGSVPVTLATVGVYLAAGLLGPVRGCAVVGLYLALGGIGLPVFAGFAGGVQQLFGPTGGFLWGYLLCALMVGLLCRVGTPKLTPVWLFCGAVALYAVGIGWYMGQSHAPLRWALLAIAPTAVGEVLKIIAASGLILSLRGRLKELEKGGQRRESES